MTSFRAQLVSWGTALVAVVLAVLLGYIWEVPGELGWTLR